MLVRLFPSARKHRISRTCVLAAMEAAGEPRRIPATDGQADDRWLWIGFDDRGVELEVIAIQQGDVWIVIHAMPTAWRNRGRKS